MASSCRSRRTPRGGIDPIRGPADALAVIRLALADPATPETVVLLLDADRRGRTIVVVEGTHDDDAVVRVVEVVSSAAVGDGHTDALVVATVRLGGGLSPTDEDRWLDASDIAGDHGLELLEWFVLSPDGHGGVVARCPRDLLAEVPRW